MRRTPGLLAAGLAMLFARPVLAASAPPVTAAHGLVVAPERRAAEVGVAILERGGNAVDAAVATALALAVTYPRAGNLAGGGFAIYRAPDGTSHALDFREVAPAALTSALFLDASGHVDPKRSLERGLSVGVPGSVRGLHALHERYGVRPWAEIVAPSVALADEGVLVSPRSAEIFAAESGRLSADPAARAIFTKDGAPLAEGDRLVQKDLAATLRGIAERGPAAFYEGPVAAAIVRAVRDTGGVLDPRDLAAYRPVIRAPLAGRYRDRTLVTFPPPSSGGVVLLEILGMLERFDLGRSVAGSSLTLHRIAEAERRAFADRSEFLGDPDFVQVPVAGLLDPSYLRARSLGIRDDRATPSARVLPGRPADSEGTETLHLSVGDAAGGAVALTTTLNSWFGSAIVAPGTGVLLNNEIDDFALAPHAANQFGLVGGAANAPAGGKRPLSSMCPTIVEDTPPGRRPRMVLGSPGGPAIISAVLQTVLHVIDDGMTLQEAVDAPRIHHQWMPDTLFVEPHALARDVADALAARGHVLGVREPIGNVCAIGVDDRGRWTGAADPRGEGAAVGY